MSQTQKAAKGPITQILVAIVWVLASLIVLLLLAHVFIRPVSPEQITPPGHFGEPCGLCHLVSDQADVIQFTE